MPDQPVNPAQKKHDRTIFSTVVYTLTKAAYHLAPGAMTRLLRVKGFSIKPYNLSAAQHELLNQAQCFYLEFNHNRIKVFEWGAGPVILLVHGWGGRALQMDAFVHALVSKGYKVVAFDHKGHGESSTNFSSYPELVRGTQLVTMHYADALHGVVAHSIGSNSMFKVSEKPIGHSLNQCAPRVGTGRTLSRGWERSTNREDSVSSKLPMKL